MSVTMYRLDFADNLIEAVWDKETPEYVVGLDGRIESKKSYGWCSTARGAIEMRRNEKVKKVNDKRKSLQYAWDQLYKFEEKYPELSKKEKTA